MEAFIHLVKYSSWLSWLGTLVSDLSSLFSLVWNIDWIYVCTEMGNWNLELARCHWGGISISPAQRNPPSAYTPFVLRRPKALKGTRNLDRPLPYPCVTVKCSTVSLFSVGVNVRSAYYAGLKWLKIKRSGVLSLSMSRFISMKFVIQVCSGQPWPSKHCACVDWPRTRPGLTLHRNQIPAMIPS